MLTQPTMEKLHALHLTAFAAAWLEQQKQPDVLTMSFDERLGLLIDAEWLARENARVARNLREAKLRISQASLEDVDFNPKRELEKPLVRQLASCQWVKDNQNVIITGMTGTGKTYLACALAQAAIRRGHRAAYRRAPRLFEELALAHADGSFPALLRRLAKVDVLVIDDWGLAPPKETERRDLLEILEDRYGARSTVITSQLDTKKWHDYLADPTVADAICDRVLHRAHRLVLRGPSRRKEDSANCPGHTSPVSDHDGLELLITIVGTRTEPPPPGNPVPGADLSTTSVLSRTAYGAFDFHQRRHPWQSSAVPLVPTTSAHWTSAPGGKTTPSTSPSGVEFRRDPLGSACGVSSAR